MGDFAAPAANGSSVCINAGLGEALGHADGDLKGLRASRVGHEEDASFVAHGPSSRTMSLIVTC